MPSLLSLIVAIVLLLVSAWPLVMALRQAGGESRRQLLLLAGLRLSALVLIALALTNPIWQRRGHASARPRLTLLLDASLSVARDFARTQATLQSPAVRQELARFDPLTLYFGDGLIAGPRAQPTARATDLSLALQQTLARDPRSPLVVVSDGAETAGDARATAARASAAGALVYTVGIGPTAPPPNVGPVAIQAPRVVREKQPVPMRALVRATGYSGAQPVQIEVDGKPSASLSAALSPVAVAAVKAQLPGLSAGYHLVTARTPARPDEATAADNVRNQIIEARRDETRVVLLAGAPDPDYAALQRLLARLPRLRAQAYVRLGQGRYLHQEKDLTNRQAPDLPKLLRDAHVVLLMNDPVGESEASQLRRFVQDGGALGWLAGKAATLRSSLPAPASSAAFVAAPISVSAPVARGALGEQLAANTSPAWWRDAPFLAGYAPLSPHAGAEVVLRARGNQALLVTGSFGTGATLMFGGAGTYRWLLSPEADEDSRRLYDAFWQTLIGWLSQPREQRRLVVIVDPAIAPEGQPVRLLAALSGATQAAVRVEIAELRAGKPAVQTVPLSPSAEAPGRYLASVSGLPPGKYNVRFVAQVGSASLQETRQLVVEPGGPELAVLTRQEANLRAIAAAGKGAYAPIEQLAQLLARIPATAVTTPITQPSHPFRSAPILALIVVLLSVEWWLRRRWGW